MLMTVISANIDKSSSENIIARDDSIVGKDYVPSSRSSKILPQMSL